MLCSLNSQRNQREPSIPGGYRTVSHLIAGDWPSPQHSSIPVYLTLLGWLMMALS